MQHKNTIERFAWSKLIFNQQKMIPSIIALSFFMEAVDSTVLNTAIPSMSKSLHVNPIDLKMALISYLLSLAIFIPISGWLSDKFGAKKLFIYALGIFTLSSLACGFADSLSDMIIARFIQGLGGALGLPVGRLIIIRTFGQHQLIAQMNHVITIGALGLMLGPYIGGYITTHFSWHWIFWINIPIGICAIFLAKYWLNSDAPKAVEPLDKIGFILFSLCLSSFTFSLSAFSESNIPTIHAFMIFIFSILCFVTYYLHSRYKTNPIVKAELFFLRTFRISIIGNLLSRMAFGGIPFLVPLFLQTILQYTPEVSGALLIPIALGVLLAKPNSIRLLRCFGFKYLLLINTLLSGLNIMLFSMLNEHSSLLLIITLTFTYGFLTSLQYSSMNALAYSDVPQDSLSAATSITGTTQQLSQSIGVAVSALCLAYFSLPSTILTEKIFHHTFLAVGLITFFSTIIFIRLNRDDGYQMII